MLFTGSSSMMIGILTPLYIVTSPLNPNTVIQQMRNWEAEQIRTPAEESINNALEDLLEDEDGSNGSTIKEELLQLPSSEDRQGSGRRYDRCHHRSWIRFIQERTGKNCGSGHTREEDKGS